MKDRLYRYNTDAVEIDFAVGEGLNAEDKRKRIGELKIIIETTKIKLKNLLGELKSENIAYVNFVGGLSEAQQQLEKASYEGFALGPAGHITIMEESRVILDGFEKNDKDLDRLLVQLNENVEQNQSQSQIQNQTFGMNYSNVILPEIKLPEFDGNLQNWNSFYEEFLAAVDEQNIPEKRKLQYLKSSLKNEPLELVGAYPLEAKNYKIVLDLLQKNYGNKMNIKGFLHSELRNLPRASQFGPEIRKTIRKIEAILKQLESLGENIEHDQLILEIESKMPKRILTKIYKKKTSDNNWSLKKMLEFLDETIKMEEDVFRAHKSFEIKNIEQKQMTKGYNNFGYNNKMKGTAMYAFNSNTERKHECKFCNELHYENECQKFKSFEERINRGKELRLCLKCLGPNHFSEECKLNIKCFACKCFGHNSAFCKKNFEQNKKLCMNIEDEDDDEFDKVLLNCLVSNEQNENYDLSNKIGKMSKNSAKNGKKFKSTPGGAWHRINSMNGTAKRQDKMMQQLDDGHRKRRKKKRDRMRF